MLIPSFRAEEYDAELGSVENDTCVRKMWVIDSAVRLNNLASPNTVASGELAKAAPLSSPSTNAINVKPQAYFKCRSLQIRLQFRPCRRQQLLCIHVWTQLIVHDLSMPEKYYGLVDVHLPSSGAVEVLAHLRRGICRWEFSEHVIGVCRSQVSTWNIQHSYPPYKIDVGFSSQRWTTYSDKVQTHSHSYLHTITEGMLPLFKQCEIHWFT